MSTTELTEYIKSEASRLGFDVCGIAKADTVEPKTTNAVEHWVTSGYNGNMSYMERNREKRYDPCLLVPDCRSIICVAMNYNTDIDEKRLHISRYAQGSDYHKAVKDRLYMLLKSINDKKSVAGRVFCDSAPVLERYWATRAGIGWIGKNRQLIIPKAGSYFFLGEILIDTELDYDTPQNNDFCGNCNICLQKCPTGALSATGFNARKCLSYLTIEYKGELPKNIGEKLENCFYGCDRCQSFCPHNRFATNTRISELQPKKELLAMNDEKWHQLSKEEYEELFSKSAVERCGYEQLKRNIAALHKNK